MILDIQTGSGSGSDVFLETDPDPTKKLTFLTKKIIYYYIDIENINSNEKKFNYDIFYIFNDKKFKQKIL